MKVHMIVSDKTVSLDNNTSVYEFVLPNMRFTRPCMKSKIIERPKFNICNYRLSNDERELLKNVFIHGVE